MKVIRLILFGILLCQFPPLLLEARAQTTVFTYQGQLTAGGAAANGNYDFQFGLYSNASGGTAIGSFVTNAGVPVANGLFTQTLDFGAAFDGTQRWLDVSVRTNGPAGAFTSLGPRQAVTPTPMALLALTSAATTGAIAAGQLPTNVALLNGNANFTGTITAGGFSGDGSGLTNLSGGAGQTATGTNQGLLSPTGFVTLNMLPAVQLNATPFRTPPMGWMSWNCCGNAGATEANCLAAAQEILTNGLLPLGYNLIEIDAGWQGYRDTNGFIHESSTRFPNGITNTIAILHSWGFKVGIWSGILPNLTPNFYTNLPPGFVLEAFADDNAALTDTNINNDQAVVNDAQTFVNWGIDYVKLEGGTNGIYGLPTEDQERRWYELFVTTAQNAGKPLYIMGAVGHECSPWMYGVLNARRCGCGDVETYDNTPKVFVNWLIDFNFAIAHPEYSGPGCFISLDDIPSEDPNGATYLLMDAMLNAELVWDNFFWAYGYFSSPAAYLTNVIQIDKDPAALMATCVLTNGNVTAWKKPLGSAASTTFALAFLNTAHNPFGYSTGGNGQFTLNDTNQSWPVNGLTNYRVAITGGAGSIQTNLIVANTATSLQVSPGWVSYALPELNSAYVILTNQPETATVYFTNIGCYYPQMQCLDLISNVTFVATNSLTVSLSGMQACGYRLTPYAGSSGSGNFAAIPQSVSPAVSQASSSAASKSGYAPGGSADAALSPVILTNGAASDYALNFAKPGGSELIQIAGDLTLTDTNLAAGRTKVVYLQSLRRTSSLAWPSGWIWMGAAAPRELKPASLLEVDLTSLGTSDSMVTAKWSSGRYQPASNAAPASAR